MDRLESILMDAATGLPLSVTGGVLDVLRGAAQVVSVDLNGVTLTGGSLDCEVVFTEA